MRTIKVRLTFTEPLLGTVGSDKGIHERFLANEATPEAIEEEAATLPEADAVEKGTGFHRIDHDENRPAIYDYAVRGFFKEACGDLKRAGAPASSDKKMRAHKKIIDGGVFVTPRLIPLQLSGPLERVTRPLRAETMQGPRVALASSEAAPVGSTMEFTVTILGAMPDDDVLTEWLDFGAFKGLGQWRSGGYGRFTYEILE